MNHPRRFILALTLLVTVAAHADPLDLPQPPDADVTGPIFRWTAPKPTGAIDRGYPKLPGVQITRLTNGRFGKMNHHPMLQRVGDRFYLAHTHNQFPHESYSGVGIGGWVSDERGEKWIGPLLLFPPVSKVEPVIAVDGQAQLLPCKFHRASDGLVYAMARVGYKSWPNGRGHNRMARHHHIGFLARSIAADGSLGDIFWIELSPERSIADDAYLRDIPDRSDTPLGRELFASGPWNNITGGNLSSEGIREPIPGKRRAVPGDPSSPIIAEFETAWLSGPPFTHRPEDRIAVCLARVAPNNNGDFRHWVAYSRDGGDSWGPFKPTEIPSAYNRSAIGQLPDGRVYIIGSLAPRKQEDRRPLAIAVSSDGMHFAHVFALLVDRVHAMHNDVVYDGHIWVATAYGEVLGRGDIAVVKIPIDQLPR